MDDARAQTGDCGRFEEASQFRLGPARCCFAGRAASRNPPQRPGAVAANSCGVVVTSGAAG
jgi:hypothetical protein